MMEKKSLPWYHKGIRFSCRGCGRCCSQGGETFVYLTSEDIEEASSFLGMEPEAFRSRYCGKEDGVWALKFLDGPCIFLKEGRCTIYPARPLQCRTWPFWPEHLHVTFWRDVVKPLCPGVGSGTLHPPEEIELTARLAAAATLLQEKEKDESP
jgi:Fe-S-cluster containining protein